MKTTITFSMRSIWCIIVLIIILPVSEPLLAQVSPYSLSPDWYFGYGGRLTFPTGSFPTSTAPAAGSVPTNPVGVFGVEASTSLCFTSGSVALYTNTMTIYNGNPANASWTANIRDFRSPDNDCAGSATCGAVSFPNPASPANSFYVVLGNDLTGGACGSKGLNQYLFGGTGIGVTYTSGPTTVAANTFASEALTVGSDTLGGYWMVTHTQSTANTFRVWHYTPAGITGPTDYTVGANVNSTAATQAYLKISPCQDKIAFNSGTYLVVHKFDRTTGAVGPELRRIVPSNFGAGLEFSPDGSKVYYSGQGSLVNYVDIASGTTGSVTGSASWSMQMGPDGNIYTSPTSSTSIGVISSANTAPSYGTVALPGGAQTYRGLSNISWLPPNQPVITASAGCPTVNFSYVFKNYFNSDISVASEEWDFDEGLGFQSGLGATPTHTFSNPSKTYQVRVRVKDTYCGQKWVDTQTVVLSCPAPINLLTFSGDYKNGQTSLNWVTASEQNNAYFEIERSDDGVNFYTIGTLKGSGTKSSLSDYNFTDTKDCSDVTYYKLTQYDIDGTKTYSNVIPVKAEKASLVVSPNPFNNSFTITFAGQGTSEIKILDVLGRIIETKTMEQNSYSITLGENLNKGAYIISVLTGAENHFYKVIKE